MLFRSESSKSLRYSRWILAPLCLVLSRGIGLSAALPTVWLASTGTSGMPRAREAELAPEVPLLSILLFLTIFPVAGSQLSLATLMLVPVVVDISACLYEDIRSFLHRSKRIEMLFCLTIATILIFGVAVNYHKFADLYRRSELMPLSLPGASRISLPSQQAKSIQEITQWLRVNCDTFYGLPGFNSYYIFTGQDVPGRATGGGAWMNLLNTKEQDAVLTDMTSKPRHRQCALRDEEVLGFWQQGRSLPSSHLIDYLLNEFKPVLRIGTTELLLRKGQK